MDDREASVDENLLEAAKLRFATGQELSREEADALSIFLNGVGRQEKVRQPLQKLNSKRRRIKTRKSDEEIFGAKF